MGRVRIMDRVNKYQLGLYEKAMPKELSWEEKLKICKESGFDYLEMSIDETDEKLARLDYDQKQRKDLIDLMWKTGVRINSICLSGHRKYPLGSHDEEIVKQGLQIMEKAIDLASDLGVRIIQLAGYDVYYETGDQTTRERFRSNLKIACELAALKGVYLGFETMETPFMDTVSKAMNFVREMDSPYLGVYPDIGNLKNASLLYHESVNRDLETGKGHIMAAHLKETLPGKYREIPFGEGHSEYVENIKMLKKLGVFLFVGEFWYVGSSEWRNELIEANRFLREKLDQVFVLGE